jgi:RNA-directed DNA polymerase
MSGDAHVRICEGLGVRFPWATRPVLVCRRDARRALEACEAISRRMDWVVHRDKTRITKRTDGFDFVGFQFGKRRRPTTGKYTMYLVPSKASQRQVRQRIKAFTTRRAPIPPDVFVQQSNQTVRGWANYSRHTNASQAYRTLQRCITTRFRRSLTSRRKGRGVGWKTYPNKTLYARGLISIGSRYRRDT